MQSLHPSPHSASLAVQVGGCCPTESSSSSPHWEASLEFQRALRAGVTDLCLRYITFCRHLLCG